MVKNRAGYASCHQHRPAVGQLCTTVMQNQQYAYRGWQWGVMLAVSLVLLLDTAAFTAEPARGDQITTAADSALVRLGERHMLITEPRMGEVSFSYFFAVVNTSAQAQQARVLIMYPEKMLSVQALVGLEDRFIGFDDERAGVVLTKSFLPGTHVHAVRFRVAAGAADQAVTWHLPAAVPLLFVLRGEQYRFIMEARHFSPGRPHELQDAELEGIVSSGVVPAGVWTLNLRGLPEDRRRFYTLAVVVMILMFGVTVLRRLTS